MQRFVSAPDSAWVGFNGERVGGQGIQGKMHVDASERGLGTERFPNLDTGLFTNLVAYTREPFFVPDPTPPLSS